MRWFPFIVAADLNDKEADVEVSVTSRKIKNQQASPPDILFRTHHYEFCIKPNEKFCAWAGKKTRFVVELRLFKREGDSGSKMDNFQQYATPPTTPTGSIPISPNVFPSSPNPKNISALATPSGSQSSSQDGLSKLQPSQSALFLPSPVLVPGMMNPPQTAVSSAGNNNNGGDGAAGSSVGSDSEWVISMDNETLKFKEFSDNDEPVVTYSFTVYPSGQLWYLNLIWPTEKKPLSWRGRFCFYISIYSKTLENTYRHVLTKVSSQFSIFSKPDVFLKKIRKDANCSSPAILQQDSQDTVSSGDVPAVSPVPRMAEPVELKDNSGIDRDLVPIVVTPLSNFPAQLRNKHAIMSPFIATASSSTAPNGKQLPNIPIAFTPRSPNIKPIAQQVTSEAGTIMSLPPPPIIFHSNASPFTKATKQQQQTMLMVNSVLAQTPTRSQHANEESTTFIKFLEAVQKRKMDDSPVSSPQLAATTVEQERKKQKTSL